MLKEIVLYSIKGKPVAFIEYDKEMIIYLMSGQAAAYLEYVGNGTCRIWGLNGKHLGWFSNDGIIYNGDAMRIGFTKEKYKKEKNKQLSVKRLKRDNPIILPAFSLNNSKSKLEQFFKRGFI